MALSNELLAERIRRALIDAGLTQRDLATALDLDPSAISRALKGKRDFKSLELALIAERLGLTVDSLLRDSGEEEASAALAARVQPSTSPTLAPALERVKQFLELDQLLSDSAFPSFAEISIPIQHSLIAYQQGEELAKSLRLEMGMPKEDLPRNLDDLASLLEMRLGIDVAFEPLPRGLDGLSVCRNGLKLALVTSMVSGTRQRYTLAHELGHLVAGDSQDVRIDENIFGSKSSEETRANAFAAEFLMPREVLRQSVPRGFMGDETIAELLGRFGVSLDALAFRLHNAEIVSGRHRDQIRRLTSTSISLRAGRMGDLQTRNDRRIPENLMRRAVEAFVKGEIGARPLAALLDVDPELLLQELSPPPVEALSSDADDVVPLL